jgi:hypothetical protein
MSRSQWKTLAGVDFARLREARIQAHYGAQWLARAARAYVPPQPDDGHTNLGWDDGFEGFTTHPLKGGTRLGIRIPDLALALLENGQAARSFPLQGRSEAEARAWLGEQVTTFDLADSALDNPLPYELPAHPLAQDGRYDTATLAEPLRELAAWYANGLNALGTVRQRLVARGLPAPEVRCWPHHFDLDCLTVIGDGAPYVAPTLGAGFSPGDHFYEEPYFYISLYPRPEISRLPSLHAPGHWHMEDFLAAVAPAGSILTLKERQAGTEAFLHSAADEIVKLLSGGEARAVN